MSDFYAVTSGNVFRCVKANSPKEACIEALKAHMYDATEPDCSVGSLFVAAKFQSNADDYMYVASQSVVDAAGFQEQFEVQ